MKLSNFREYTEHSKSNYAKVSATVDVTTGFLFWKKTVPATIARKNLNWFFADSGDWTPEYQAEHLEKAYHIKRIREVK